MVSARNVGVWASGRMAQNAILTLTGTGDSGRMAAGSANGRGPNGVIGKEFRNKELKSSAFCMESR